MYYRRFYFRRGISYGKRRFRRIPLRNGKDSEPIPAPSDPKKLAIPQGAFVSMIEAWTDYIRDEMENKSIKKTLTIPKWLNDAAEAEGINFSQLLQFAVKERLGMIKKSKLRTKQ
ncbi:hypothetical protein LG52_869 [Geobacillus kaustophilus]|uniref:HicB family protein n=1 Tax=Geobacillus kaustophilus TaxID=1462 RepID=A0A0D8BZM8_GEOKU|nr:hypothetical protein [Geobacillus kaustophilus]KJE28827.1 hypothetical protein LG52_869 [Geobacillus kaustophilus]